LEVTEPGARAGDVVHFTISGTNGLATYDLEVGDVDVLEKAAAGGDHASGAFTMPDLGNPVRTVKIEAEIWESGKRKKVKRKLEYLGPALAVSNRPAPTPVAPAPVVVPQTPAAPEPISSPTAIGEPSPAPIVTPPSTLRPHQSSKRRATQPRRHVKRGGEHRQPARHGTDRRKTAPATKRAHAKRQGPRTAPLFDGVPEPGAGTTPDDDDGFLGLKAIAPRNVSAHVRVEQLHDGGLGVATVVPALLGLAALMLAATALTRSRRLASRRG
jgi:hypothetical protein